MLRGTHCLPPKLIQLVVISALQPRSRVQQSGYGVAAGDPFDVGGGDGCASKANFSLLKSWLPITKAPSRPSTFAQAPSLVLEPMISLCVSLSSGEVVKVTTSCGFSKPCCAPALPNQRTARRFDKVSRSDCRLA